MSVPTGPSQQLSAPAYWVVDPTSGWLAGARRAPSPNFDERPAGTVINTLIVHSISMPPGQFGGRDVERFFTNTLDWSSHPFYRQVEGMTVSSHLFIRRSGEVVQFVPLKKRAWHAGLSVFDGRARVNDFSIGIELEGCDEMGFEQSQYRALVEVTESLMSAFPALTPDRIAGHADIAPGRKTDPGPHFDWARYRAALRAR
jgi:AmpD protein